MLIKIIATPQGDFAPLNIRELWVGIEMESAGREKPEPTLTDFDILIGRRVGNQNRGGYKVSGAVALAALQKHSEEAHLWWQANLTDMAGTTLIFHADVCQEVS